MSNHVIETGSIVTVDQSNLPEHGVARHRDIVPASGDVGIDGIATSLGPVLVVAYTKHQLIVVEQRRVGIKVRRHGVVEAVAASLGPFDEPAFVGEPAGRSNGRRIAMLVPVGLEDLAIGVGFLPKPDRSGLTVVAFHSWTIEEATTPRPAKRDLMAAGVQAGTAPRVVSVPCVGAKYEQRPLPRRGRPNDETTVSDVASRRSAMSREGDQIETAGPLRIGRDLERDRPVASVGVGPLRGRVVASAQTSR